jgi:hypothetical protein
VTTFDAKGVDGVKGAGPHASIGSGGPLPPDRPQSTRRSEVCATLEPILDAVVIVLGLAAVALTVWVVISMLTLGI